MTGSVNFEMIVGRGVFYPKLSLNLLWFQRPRFKTNNAFPFVPCQTIKTYGFKRVINGKCNLGETNLQKPKWKDITSRSTVKEEGLNESFEQKSIILL